MKILPAFLCSILMLGISGVGAAQSAKEPIGGSYTWDSKDDASRYDKAKWAPITTTRVEGFAPLQLVEKKTEGCGSGNKGSFVRREGGLCTIGVWLESKGKPAVKINSVEKLRARFAPVESEAEAVSFVSVLIPDLKWKDPEMLLGHVIAADDGYLVQAVAKNTFGCRTHAPTGVIFKVSRDGTVKQIAVEPEPEPVGPTMCVD